MILVNATTCPLCYAATNGSICLDCQAEGLDRAEALLELDIDIPADDRDFDDLDLEMGFESEFELY